MKKNVALSIISLFLFNLASGQDNEKYASLINEAFELYNTKEYHKSGVKYSEAFVALNHRGMVNDRYNAACSWALGKEIDSSFVQLFKIGKNGNYTNYNHITTDTDLDILHTDKRWKEVISIVKANKDKAEANLDKPLVAELEAIYNDDQSYRRELNAIEKEFGRDSKEIRAQWQTIALKDSLNLIKIQKILDTRGWLGSDVIGGQGNSTLFLVIQHANIEVQKKYLPIMREAVKNKKANPSSLALLEDRVALRIGGKQIYGSQIGRDQETGNFYVLPLQDPDNVDARRNEVGLGSIQSYIANWNLTWDVEAYKKQLPEIEAKQKK